MLENPSLYSIKKKMFALYVYVMIRPCYDEVKSTDEARKKSSS